jgi:hypothetical protein
MASMDGSFQIVKERKAKRSRLETKIVQLTPFVFSCLKERCGGGADRDRTGDPLLAKQVLSQLSYSPLLVSSERRIASRAILGPRRCCGTIMVGLGRLELPTSPLSGVRSNHLSYRPKNRALELSTVEGSASSGTVSGTAQATCVGRSRKR